MYIIPTEILFLCQVFGMFPMLYTMNTKKELSIKFSSTIFKWGLILIPFLSIGSYFTLFLDLAEFFNNGKSHVSSTTGVFAALISNVVPNIMVVVFFITSHRNYPKYIEMSQILEKIDDTLHLKVITPKTRLKCVLTFGFISMIVGISFYKDFHKNPFLCSNSYIRSFYYFQATLLVHFTFVVEAIEARFRLIRQKIKEEVLRPSLFQLMSDMALLHNYSSRSEGLSQVHRIEMLIDLFYQLSEAVEKARYFFDNQLFATITCSFINNTTTLYYFFSAIQQFDTFVEIKSNLLQGAWVFSHLTHITSLFMPSTSLTDTIKETAQEVSQLISWETNSKQVKTQMETFLYQLLHKDHIGFTGLGMFKIHGSILVSIASSVSTYLIIMLQFQ